jgi:aminopeptidase-like protein
MSGTGGVNGIGAPGEPLETPERLEAAGREMHALAGRLYPILRSITGDGVRRTLEILGERVPLEVREVPSGSAVLDWTVPPEWNLREAWIKGPGGRTVVDVRDHTLHVLNYSAPIHRTVSLAELREHLFTLPDQPDRIPYRTSYYNENWGFCLRHRTLEALEEGEYEVLVDSTLDPEGSLTYGELVIPGETDREVLVSTHVCHPSLANDNLSGLTVTTFLARQLLAATRSGTTLRHTYRFLWIPGTIGSITWLARNRDAARRVVHGLVAANLGDAGHFHYKRSRRGDAVIDRAVEHLLKTSGDPYEIEDFVPFGYDERQYCSPGFDLPVGSLTRAPWGRYPEYHTSGDDLGFLRPERLGGSLSMYLRVVELLEGNRTYRNLHPEGEPQLGRRGLYAAIGGASSEGERKERQLAILWVLNLSDGSHSLLDVARRAGMPFRAIRTAADALLAADLLEEVPASDATDGDGAPGTV